MKHIAYMLNGVMLLTAGYLCFIDGPPQHWGWPDIFFAILFLTAPASALAALGGVDKRGSKSERSWLSLYLERKKAEERAKLEQLSKKI